MARFSTEVRPHFNLLIAIPHVELYIQFFKVIWRHIVTVTINTFCIVESFDVFKYKAINLFIITDFKAMFYE